MNRALIHDLATARVIQQRETRFECEWHAILSESLRLADDETACDL